MLNLWKNFHWYNVSFSDIRGLFFHVYNFQGYLSIYNMAASQKMLHWEPEKVLLSS